MQIANELSKNIVELQKIFPIETSYDLITRTLYLGETKAFWLGINGFCKNDLLQRIFSDLQNSSYTRDSHINDLNLFVASKIGYIQTELTTSWDAIIKNVLSGTSVLFIDGFDSAIILDTRSYPVRSIEEPDTEKVTQGSRDGFVETIVFNTALLRRRIRNPKLSFEVKTVGSDTKTDVVIGYIGGMADPKLVNAIRQKLDGLDVPSLTMGAKSLEELIVKKRWFNPLPQIRYTERPDVASSYLLEGYVVVIVDNSPSVLVFPCTLFQFTQNPEDYYQNPSIGNYLRFLRFLCILISLFLMPVFLLLGIYSDMLPKQIQVITTEQTNPVSLFIYVIIIELGLDIFKYSSSNAASGLSNSLGLIGGLIIGDVAIQLKWATLEVIFYGAVTVLATLSISSQEFGGAVRLYRLVLIFLTGFFHLSGFIIGVILILISIGTTPSFAGKSYLWPLIPWDWKALKTLLFRYPTAKYEITHHSNKKQKF